MYSNKRKFSFDTDKELIDFNRGFVEIPDVGIIGVSVLLKSKNH